MRPDSTLNLIRKFPLRDSASFLQRQLALLGSSLLISFVLVALWTAANRPLVLYHHTRASMTVDRLSVNLIAAAHRGLPLTDDVVQRWLRGELSAEETRTFGLREEGPFVDPWGNAYVAVRRVQQPGGNNLPYGVYSKGSDGISLTQGNDPDDLRSWNADGRRFYEAKIESERNWELILPVVLLTPIVHLLLHVATRRRRACCAEGKFLARFDR